METHPTLASCIEAIAAGNLSAALPLALAVQHHAAMTNDAALAGEALYRQCQIHYLHSDFAAASTAGAEAGRQFETAGDDRGLIRALSAVANAHCSLMQFEEAGEIATRATSLAERLGDPLFMCIARNNLGCVYLEMSDYQSAEPVFEQVCAEGEAMGNAKVVVDAQTNLVWITFARARLQHEYDPATPIPNLSAMSDAAARLLSAIQRAGMSGGYAEGVCRTVEAFVAIWSRDHSAARLAFAHGIQISDRLGNAVLRAGLKMAECEIHLAAGDMAAAFESIEEALRSALSCRNAPLQWGARVMRARLLQMLARYDEAIDEYRSLLASQRTFLVAGTLNRARVSQIRSDAARERDSLLSLARTDPLTGLSSRRLLDDLDAKRRAEPAGSWAVAMIDVDDFKRINDERSHLAGDAVLKCIADVVRATIRRSDFAIRYAGDEFLLVLPGASKDDAMRQVERLQDAMASHAWDLVGWPVTISVGVAVGTSAHDLTTIIAAADQDMYEHKRLRRRSITCSV